MTGQLSQLSHVELATVEIYERAHGNRPAVLGKLRYMRGSDPLAGYDALSPDEIATALSGADAETLNAMRDDERKFACRRQVMEEPRESFRRRRRVHEKHATGKSKTRAYMRDSQVPRKPAVALPIAGRRRRSTTDVDAPPAAKRASHAGAVERAEAARDEREQLRERRVIARSASPSYRARLYGGRAASQGKLRELQRASDGASARLRRAEAAPRLLVLDLSGLPR